MIAMTWPYVQDQLKQSPLQLFLYHWFELEARKSYENFLMVRAEKPNLFSDSIFKTCKERMSRWNQYVSFVKK